jgi:uncharacterized membrane protein
MIAASVEFYDVVVFLHITAVVLAFGPTFAYAVFFAVAARGEPAGLAAVGRGVLTWDRSAGTIGMTLIVLSGLYLAGEEPWSFGDFFVSWGLAAILVLFGMAHGFFIPTTKRFVDAVEAGREDEVQALTAKFNVMGPIAGLIVILTIYVMTAKPFL